MNRFTRFIAVLGLFVFATPLLAQNNGIIKIGVVNIDRLLGESPQFQAARAKLEDEFAPRQREIISLQTALQDKAAKLEQDMPVMGESEREAAQRELRNDERDLMRSQAGFREDAQARENEIMRDIQQEIGREVVGYGEAEGYDIILPAGGSGAVFASPRVDITGPLIERLKAAYKADGS